MHAPGNPIAEEIRAQRMINSLTKRETLADVFSPMDAPPAPAQHPPRARRNINVGQSITRVFKSLQQQSRAASARLSAQLEPECDPC